MKIVTWNINGIRSSKTPLKDLLDSLDADIICLQETKITRDQLDECCAIVEGYNSYFSFSRTKSGYSGVATFVKNTCIPEKAEEGLSGLFQADSETDNIGYYGDFSEFTSDELFSLDAEGRALLTQHHISGIDKEATLVIINVYCPRADPDNDDRKVFKTRFYELLQKRADAILSSKSHVIIVGDMNTSHKKIDHCDPGKDSEFYANPGRQWLSQFLGEPVDNGQASEELTANCTPTMNENRIHFMDLFRFFRPSQESAFTCWSTVTGARATNYGTRIDYILADSALVQKGAFSDCFLLQDFEGSDHCPVKGILAAHVHRAKRCPPLCTKYYPEFSGKQQKLLRFFNSSSLSKTLLRTEDLTTGQCDIEGSLSSSSSILIIAEDEKVRVIKSPVACKRSCSDPSDLLKDDKKIKTSTACKGIAKQRSLLSFMTKKNSEISIIHGTSSKSNETEIKANISTIPDCDHQFLKSSQGSRGSSSESDKILDADTSASSSSSDVGNVKAASSWKLLLAGPPKAPLCRGHKEACVLRTVKKDGTTKGRQFWVCNKPEGHKTNPEARCDHFEWVRKKM